MYKYEELKVIINKAIRNISLDQETEKLFEPVRYIMSAGGKRLRPVLSLMACNLFDDKVENAILPAVGLEVFHNFTLVHDDIMDEATLRRGAATVHNKWDNKQAILSGDVMAFIANDCMMHAHEEILPDILKVYNKAAVEVCMGQQMDMEFEEMNFVSISDYMRMIELKTAVLIAASLKIGAILGGAGSKDTNTLYSFGINLGLAFQIQDDLLDTFGDSGTFGKNIGGDIVANKKTILLIKALELASGDQHRMLSEQIKAKGFNPQEKIDSVISVYKELNIQEEIENLVSRYTEKAYSLLMELDIADERKEALRELASNLLDRNK